MMIENTENRTKKYTVMDIVEVMNMTCESWLDFCDEGVEMILDSCGDKAKTVMEPYSDAVKVLSDGSMKVLVGKGELILGYCMLGKTIATQTIGLGKKVIAKIDNTDIKVYK